MTPPDPSTSHHCARCLAHPNANCRSCAARRRTVIRLLERQSCSIEQIAEHMHITPCMVMRLIEEAHDRREIEQLRASAIDTRIVREKFEAWREQDPKTRTHLELARLAGMGSSSRVQRLLGEIPTSTVVKGDVVYPGRRSVTISTDNAGRLVRAMGYTPCEIPGL